MTEPRNMDEPVTRRELHEALEIWGGTIKSELRAEMTEVRAEMRAGFAAQSAEIAQHIRASEERMRDFMRALLEPHDGIPERVARLESKVLAPKRRRRTARRR